MASPFIEKSNYENSPHINDSIKLIALQEWLEDKNIKEIKLISSNKNLAICLKNFCIKKGIIFKFIYQYKLSPKKFFKDTFKNILPSKLKAILWLARKVKFALKLSNIGIKEYQNCRPDFIFVDYLMNFNEKSLLKGEFQSNYWGNLINIIEENSINALWIHLPVNLGRNISFLNNKKDVIKYFQEFHLNSEKLQNHVILDSFLNFNILKQSFLDWQKISKKGEEINLENKLPKIKDLNLWPLYKEEWKDSINGVLCISNCIMFNLFNKAFNLKNNNIKLIYLLENQSWEFAMIQAYRKNISGDIIGYIHSCVSYWDLRKFFDSKTLSNSSFPQPDKYGLNGNLSKNNFFFNNIEKKKLLKLEATRYLYLNNLLKQEQKSMK